MAAVAVVVVGDADEGVVEREQEAEAAVDDHHEFDLAAAEYVSDAFAVDAYDDCDDFDDDDDDGGAYDCAASPFDCDAVVVAVDVALMRRDC